MPKKRTHLAFLTILMSGCLFRSWECEALALKEPSNDEKENGAAAMKSKDSVLDAPSCSANGLKKTILEHILADDYEKLDPEVLPRSVETLKTRGAHRCWHKHSTFLEHLLGVHNILRLWGQSKTIGRVGLFHSAYSNSYVNLALYDPATERNIMRELVGDRAEELVYLFCIIDRQQVVVNTLLQQGYIPAEGLEVPHLRHANETVFLDAETLHMLLVFTMADISDQYFGWQDQLFGGGGHEGSMAIPSQDQVERHRPTALWPGVSKPGLWMSYLSDLMQVARTFSPWESGSLDKNNNDNDHPQDIPPIFDHGQATLSVQDETKARDLYWSVITEEITDDDEAIAILQECIARNKWAFEPQIALAQKLLHRGDRKGTLRATSRALELQEQWGTAWDKRLSFAAWRAWTHVLHQRAQDGDSWPESSWAVNNLGLVRSD